MANQIVELADDRGNLTGKSGLESALSYQDLNAMINLWGQDEKLQLEKEARCSQILPIPRQPEHRVLPQPSRAPGLPG